MTSVLQLRLADFVGARCCVNVAGAFGPIWDGAYKDMPIILEHLSTDEEYYKYMDYLKNCLKGI
ncbi:MULTISPECIES: hypothetical protein [unclassified Butyrivibrio]|uniref:hypothetical protein n=1 Tax=unclassified Butyrivibrio TaxID=2639466 RepID=UPI0003B608B5|nr:MULTISPECIES: hypothetical protein [unclassified Butyrivibrio]MDC7292327.1 hypothetical protein [Butyrivibrio sp. DSM 10294]